MHLLLIESNPESARDLHRQFLDYRGVNWSLSYCTDYRAAIEMLEQGSFQSVLLSSDCPYEKTLLAIHELMQVTNCPPLVTVTGELSTHEQLNLVADGSDDCFNRSEISGAGIMRQLRMAEVRNSVCHDRAAKLLDGHIVGFSVDAFLKELNCEQQHSNVSDSNRVLSIAHVASRASLVDPIDVQGKPHEIYRFDCIRDVLNELDESEHRFNALIIEQSVFEYASESDTLRLEKYLTIVPGIVLTLEKSDYSALSYLELGYSDCLIADDISTDHLLETVQKAVARRRRELLRSLTAQQVGPHVNDRRRDLRDSNNRRRHVRFRIELPITAIPILPSGAPDFAGCCDAIATTISLGGIGVTIPHQGHLPRRNWILGVEQPDGSTGYVSAFLRQVSYSPGEIQGGLVFQNESGDFFRPENLWPQLNPADGRLTTRIAGPILDHWIQLGVLTKRLARRARTCPECESLCSVGTGCQQCGGFELKFEELIHHFACAYVDKSAAFEQEDTIQCPKCLCDDLVAGADFEVFRSHYTCQCCEHQGDVTAEVGCCLNCQLRFPAKIAPEVEVYGYDVERLDVLAIVDIARRTSNAGSSAADI